MSLASGGTAGQRLTKAARYMLKQCAGDKLLFRNTFTQFEKFARGRFMDFGEVCEGIFS